MADGLTAGISPIFTHSRSFWMSLLYRLGQPVFLLLSMTACRSGSDNFMFSGLILVFFTAKFMMSSTVCFENWTFDLFLKLILSASGILRTLQYQDPCLHDVLVQKELLGFLFLYLVQVSLELIFICEKKLWGDYNSESFLRTHVMLAIHLVILLEGHLFPRRTLFLHTFSFPFDCTAAT